MPVELASDSKRWIRAECESIEAPSRSAGGTLLGPDRILGGGNCYAPRDAFGIVSSFGRFSVSPGV
jgi:hypothetical protein